ncbi:MAG: DUF5777 family beta-barrel protein [Chitinophagales bacterium]
MRSFFTLLLLSCFAFTHAQDNPFGEIVQAEQKKEKEYVKYTFKTTRILNGQSVEMVGKYAMDFRVSHRFGDVAASNNDHIHTLLGFDKADDIGIICDFGITDDLSVGFARMKGAGDVKRNGSIITPALHELWNVNLKYRVLKQTTNFKIPLTIVLYGNAAISSMRPGTGSTALNNFGSGYKAFSHRMTYNLQALIACKATDWLSIQLSPTFIWRNLVPSDDKNGLFFLGLGARAKFNRRGAIVFEYFLPLMKEGVGGRSYFAMLRGMKNAPYYPSLHIGVEFETGGHVFHINLTNSRGLLEQDFLPYNNSNWAQGAFRLGFTISRIFQLDQKMGRYWKKGSIEDQKK